MQLTHQQLLQRRHPLQEKQQTDHQQKVNISHIHQRPCNIITKLPLQ